MISPDGRWELRYVNLYEVSEPGHGNGSWQFDLVELASGHVVRSWHGWAQRSPSSQSSGGTTSVRWDGEGLLVVEDDGTEHRVAPR